MGFLWIFKFFSDTVELKNRLEFTEQQNRRLGEELSDRREQLNVADDTVAQLKQENGQLKYTLKWYLVVFFLFLLR